MLEYLFFTQKVADKFILFVKERDITWEQKNDPMLGSIVIETPEDITDELWDEMDDYHDSLGEQDKEILEAELATSDTETNAAGIYIQLENGKQTVAQIDPDVMNRMLSVISMEEFNAFIETIVSSVEKPDDAAICEQSLI